MEGTNMVICDTNILIELFKNNEKVKARTKEIGINNLAVSAVSIGEFYYGAFDKREMQRINKHLTHYKTLNLTPEMTEIFINLMHKYSLSHKPFIGDMLIAATALANNAELFTLNLKDFKFIPEIKLTKW